ncbi:MAG: NAD(P)/FAD-dependent oxidoreductase [Chitinivibrionia bacterium]|nr:NAD(P)/FAD-dependent oxidoreductase [Chitinivibrionia bacterium]
MVKQCIVIGGGPAGTAAALSAVGAGAGSVLLVERDALGGTCTNRGCIPTKFFLSKSSRLYEKGAPSVVSAAEWGKVVAHKNALVQGLSRSIAARCQAKGVEIAKGSARFINSHEIEVIDSAGGRVVHEGERIIIATGSRPAELPGAPSDGNAIITSDEALYLNPLPRSLAIIGSGAVGAEFAFIFTRLGVAVTIIEAAPRLFPAEDADVDAIFRKTYARMGVTVHTGSSVVGIETRAGGSGVTVLLDSGTAVEADKALVGIGRILETGSLDCEAGGIDLDPRGGIKVGDDLRTSQPHVFAAGDVTGKMLLAHAASYMGEYAGRKANGGSFPPVPYHSIPWATFTSPEVAAVGLSLERAEHSGVACTAGSVPLMDNVKARIDRTTDGFVKVVLEKGTGRIIGGTIVGPHASDLIHIIALAIHQRMTLSDTRGFCFAHPSIAESIGDLLSLM